MNELANSESLQKLEHRHDELLEKLDQLCLEIESALKKLAPPTEHSPRHGLSDAA